MTTITREQQKQILIDTANHVISRDNTSPYSENLRELARIALASLEAEPIGAFHIADQQVDGTSDYIEDGEWPIDNGIIEVYAAPPALQEHRNAAAEPDYIRYDCGCCGWETIKDWRENDACPKCNHKPMGKTELYTAPPAPVVVPDERCRHLSELYHAQEKRLFKLAQRIKGPSFDKYAHSPSQAIDVLESALFGDSKDTSCAAMLQGSQPVTTPKKLTFEQWLSQRTGTIDVECGCVMTEVFFHWLRVAYEAGNSPVICEGRRDEAI